MPDLTDMPDLTEVQLNKLNLELRKSRKKSLTVTDSRIHGFLVGTRQLVRQDGVGRPILQCATAATYPDAHTNWRAPTKKIRRNVTDFSSAEIGAKYLRADHLRLHTETLVSSRLSGR